MRTSKCFAGFLFCIILALSAAGQNSLTNGLVAFYPFSGNANDASGNGYDGTVFDASLTNDFLGNADSAYYFNGNDSAVNLPAATCDSVSDGSLAAWVKLDRNSIETIFSKQHDGDNSYGIFSVGMYCNESGNPTPGTPGVLYFVNNRFGNQASSQVLLTTGVWYHVVSTFSTTGCNLYVNGTNVGTFTGDFSMPADYYPTATSIGFWEGQGPTPALSGAINNFLIYNRALSANEVAQLFQSGGTPLPYIIQQPQNVTNNLGDTVTLSVLTDSTNALGYTWVFSGTNVETGTSSTITITNIAQAYFGSYHVIATYTNATITSGVANIFEPATIASQPVSVVAAAKGTAMFTVAAVGNPPVSFYQWTFNGTNIPGANADTLAINSVGLATTGNYQVLASNLLGSAISSVVTLNMSPEITVPFVGATPIWGRAATISVSAAGSGQLSYQWYYNGEPIAGAIYPSLNFPSIQFTNNGFYSVVVSSPYGSITNTAAQIAVNPAVVTLGFSPTLTINGAAGDSYFIQRSADLTNTNNWKTLTSLTLTQPIEIWVDTSIDASSPFNNKYFYQLVPAP